MIKQLSIILFLFLWTNLSIASESTQEELRRIATFPPKTRIESLHQLQTVTKVRGSDDSSIEVINRLIADAQYEILKQQEANNLFEIAKRRLSDAPKDMSFSRYVAVYDSLSIAQSINGAWLLPERRKEYLEWRIFAENELISLLAVLEPNKNAVTFKGDVSSSKDSANYLLRVREIADQALKDAVKEDLRVIKNAVPNKLIQGTIEKCENARTILIKADPQLQEYEQAKWDNTMTRLNKVVLQLRIRQQLKYSLWAEQIYRSNRIQLPKGDRETEALYKQLGMIDLSLLMEPSLAKEIAQRMYELYDKLGSMESKARLRYDTIMQLDKRKNYEDF